jgi:hypothetical protein
VFEKQVQLIGGLVSDEELERSKLWLQPRHYKYVYACMCACVRAYVLAMLVHVYVLSTRSAGKSQRNGACKENAAIQSVKNR